MWGIRYACAHHYSINSRVKPLFDTLVFINICKSQRSNHLQADVHGEYNFSLQCLDLAVISRFSQKHCIHNQIVYLPCL
jgi:hypothetical protein